MRQLELRIPPLVLVLLIAGLMGLTASVTREVLLPMAVRSMAAAIVLGLGVTVVLAGAFGFRRAKTTVNPLQPSAATSLVTGGIYRFSRNPMYLGFLFCLCGWGLYLANLYTVTGPVIFVLYMNRFQIVPEERALDQKFGAHYQAYCRRARRWL